MTEAWRTFLYPLGFVAGLLFAARFISQWLQSEKEGRSLVPRSFWHLSLAGNLLLAIHAFIQIQYHVCLVQVCNGVIAWRNLNLMQKQKPAVSFSRMVCYLIAAAVLTTLFFALQSLLLEGSWHWFRVPVAPWQQDRFTQVSSFWHALGFVGYLLFSSRFWIQWWLSEKQHDSCLPPSFWWISLGGALLSCAYFMRIGDLVNLIGPAIGIVPYVRNLMLIHQTQRLADES